MGWTDYVPGAAPIGRTLGLMDSNADSLNEDAQSAVAQSNANAQGAYNLALQQAAAAGAIQAPGAVNPLFVATPQIQSTPIDTANTVNTATPKIYATGANAEGYNATLGTAVNSADDIRSYNVALAKAQEAARAGSANVADVDTSVDAPEVGKAALAKRAVVDAVDVGDLANDTRFESLNAALAIQNSPSAANAQFKAGMDQAISDALGAAGQARGQDRAGARREAIIQLGMRGGQAAEAAAATAAQEDTAKRAAYAAALQNVRSADVSVSQTQAQIDAQRVQTQAQLDAAIEQGNAAQINALRTKQAELDLQARTAEVQAGLQQQSTGAGLAKANMDAYNQVALANAANATNVNLANASNQTKAAADYAAAKNASEQQFATNATGISATNAAATTKAAADLAAARNAASQQYAGLATGVSTTQAQLDATRAENNAQRAASLATADASNRTQAAVAQGNLGLQSQTTNAGNQLNAAQINNAATLDTEKIRQAGTTSAISGMNQAAGVQSGNAGTVAGASKAAAETQQKSDAAIIGGAASAYAASDERAKHDIKKAPDAAVADLAEKLSAYTWRYKPGYEDGGQDEHGGVMAQDVEKSPLGKKFVHEDSEGTKHVDVLSLAAMMAAAAARSVKKSNERRT